MSGGTWNYMDRDIEDWADHAEMGARALRLMAVLEHELDWGHAGDSCLACARLRMVAAVEQYFTDRGHEPAAIAIARDWRQNHCPDERCARRAARA